VYSHFTALNHSVIVSASSFFPCSHTSPVVTNCHTAFASASFPVITSPPMLTASSPFARSISVSIRRDAGLPC
jgi:hypothetical protein